jgi:RNA polymerase sigma factor (sigma-70 family)
MDDSATALLARCAHSDDPTTWRSFEKFFKPRLLAAITRTLWRSHQRRDADLVDELLQETWCRLLAGERRILKAFTGDTEGAACVYLMRVAESVTLDGLRRGAAIKRGSEFCLVRGHTAESLANRILDPTASPEARAVRRDLWKRFWQRCQHLSGSRDVDRDLEILDLALFQGWTSREIAKSKGLRASTVDTVIHRLRRRLGRHGLNLPARPRAVHEVAEPTAEADEWRSGN